MQMKKFDVKKFTARGHTLRVEKPWGYEEIFTPADLPYTQKHIHLKKGARTSLQLHEEKIETNVLVTGECLLTIEDKARKLIYKKMHKLKGYTLHIGQKHRLTALTDVDLFETSTPEKGITYRLEDDYSRLHETEKMRKENRKPSMK